MWLGLPRASLVEAMGALGGNPKSLGLFSRAQGVAPRSLEAVGPSSVRVAIDSLRFFFVRRSLEEPPGDPRERHSLNDQVSAVRSMLYNKH